MAEDVQPKSNTAEVSDVTNIEIPEAQQPEEVFDTTTQIQKTLNDYNTLHRTSKKIQLRGAATLHYSNTETLPAKCQIGETTFNDGLLYACVEDDTWVAVTSKYETTEHRTGAYWTDGRPIFRQVITFGTLPNATIKNVAFTTTVPISNYSQTVSLRALTDTTSLITQNSFETADATSVWWSVNLASGSNAQIRCSTLTNFSTSTATVIVEYTKVTS